MTPLSVERFRDRSEDYDRSVAARPEIDRFCSSSDWILPAHEALMPPREPLIFEQDGGWIALARGADPRGFEYLEPLEASWGLTSPLVGASISMFLDVLSEQRWDLVLLAGLIDGSHYQRAILRALLERFSLRRGTTTVRYVADLTAGLEGYLGRRSRNFRRSLRRTIAHASKLGIEFEIADDADPASAFERVLAVDQRSWKGKTNQGITGTLADFYRRMLPRLSSRGALRLRFARLEDRDVAFILGGMFAGTYRGLQFGFDAEHAEVGLGNLLQVHQIEALCEQGIATYDIGTTSGHYKRRWSDRIVGSTMFLVSR